LPEFGYHADWFDDVKIRSYADLAATLYRRGTQGIIITGEPDPKLFENREKWSPFSIVQCGRYRAGLPVHTVRPDIFRSIKLLFMELRRLGYKRIGFGFGRHFPMLEDDEARFAAALALNEFYVEPKNRVSPYFGDFSHKREFIEWVKQNAPDVVIGFSVAQWYY